MALPSLQIPANDLGDILDVALHLYFVYGQIKWFYQLSHFILLFPKAPLDQNVLFLQFLFHAYNFHLYVNKILSLRFPFQLISVQQKIRWKFFELVRRDNLQWVNFRLKPNEFWRKIFGLF